MKRYNATVTKEDYKYLKKDAVNRSQKKEGPVSVSEALREIIKEHQSINCNNHKLSKDEKGVNLSFIKITVTIEEEDCEYLEEEAIYRSKKRGKKITKSQSLREVINEHRNLKDNKPLE